MDRENTCGIFLTNSFTRPEEGGKEGGEEGEEEGGPRTRRNVTTAGCFVNYFLRALEARLFLARRRGDERGRVLKRRRKSEYKQNRERKAGGREEDNMEDEEVEGHCDCLALTFASHILPGCQWHSTDEFLIATSSLCSRTETRYPI